MAQVSRWNLDKLSPLQRSTLPLFDQGSPNGEGRVERDEVELRRPAR